MPVQKQRDGHSFGIFAVGFASKIFDGKSPTDAVFHIPQLCNDLIYCLERRALTPFPKISIKNVNKATEELLYQQYPWLVHELILLLIFCIKGLMTKTKEFQQLYWYFWVCY